MSHLEWKRSSVVQSAQDWVCVAASISRPSASRLAQEIALVVSEDDKVQGTC